MTVEDKILEVTAALYGAEDPKLPLICSVVIQHLKARLKNGISIDDCRDSFIYASALMSLSIVKTVDNDQLSGFDAGTLKLNFTDRSDQISSLAEKLLAPWVRVDDFAFCGVGE